MLTVRTWPLPRKARRLVAGRPSIVHCKRLNASVDESSNPAVGLMYQTMAQLGSSSQLRYSFGSETQAKRSSELSGVTRYSQRTVAVNSASLAVDAGLSSRGDSTTDTRASSKRGPGRSTCARRSA